MTEPSAAMTRTELITSLKAMLGGTAEKFSAGDDADFRRQLDLAALALARRRPRAREGTVVLEAGVHAYDLPEDCAEVLYSLWGRAESRRIRPWAPHHPGPLPRHSVVETGAGRKLVLDPAPTLGQLQTLGSAYRFRYLAAHRIGDEAADTTVQPADRHLLLLRALAEAMAELAAREITAPVQLHRGIGSVPRNGTPAALHEQLLKTFEMEAAR